jgi:hypothetical protein
MKQIHAILLGLFVVPAALRAQNPGTEPISDPVLEAIQKFQASPSGKPNEVKVELPAPKETHTPPVKKIKDAEIPPEADELVTGPPSDDSEPVTDPAEITAPDPQAPFAEDAPTPPREGLIVRVTKIKTGSGEINPDQVKLSAPFPAKPLTAAPVGWRLESSNQVPPFTRDVELSPGKHITLSIRPHVLVPEADGQAVFSVLEPGFEPSLGYQQATTVGAVLSTSVRQLEEDSKHMGEAIDKLQQLLSSLPMPESAEEIPAKSATNKSK